MDDASPLPDFTPLEAIRVDTALSRLPVHTLSKRGGPVISIRGEQLSSVTVEEWRVSYSSEHGPPRQLAHKIDKILVDRKIDEARPHGVPKVLRIGTLGEVCRELGLTECGKNKRDIEAAFYQNAFTAITAKLRAQKGDGTERLLRFGATRYDVLFMGDELPDGNTADAVYIVLHDLYWSFISAGETRPLDYDYLKALSRSPVAQRFYELFALKAYGAIKRGEQRVRYLYSEFCTYAPQTRYHQFKRVHMQMKEVHAPHIGSGYIQEPIQFVPIINGEGQPDWEMFYALGTKALEEHATFNSGRKLVKTVGANTAKRSSGAKRTPPRQQALSLPNPEPKKPESDIDPETEALVAELVVQELNFATAVLYAKGDPQECRRQLVFVSAMTDEDFTGGRGAYLARAIPEKWGPPKQFKAKQRRAEADRKKQGEAARENTRKTSQEARRDTLVAEGMLWVGRLEKEHAGAYSAFNAAADHELETLLKRHTGKMAQESFRRLYAGERKRLELFLAYFTQHPCPLPELSAWLAEHGAELRRLLAER